MVIFLFLRSLSATIIPGIAVPLSLVGTFAVMYMLGYSLDNLSLMALTISTGFVVDDAIVMIEKFPAISKWATAHGGRAQGFGEIGFTIVSLTVSLTQTPNPKPQTPNPKPSINFSWHEKVSISRHDRPKPQSDRGIRK